jgi:sterol desaturase/sphingolipid hydroxylase (fatty acid hydroxylase superfamily)
MQQQRWLRAAVRYSFLPVMVIGFMGAGVWLASVSAPKWQIVALLAGAVAVSLAAERVAPYEPGWNDDRDDTGRDVAHVVVNEGLQIVGLLAVPALVGVIGVDGAWPTKWPFVLQVAVAVIVLDAGITLGHWWSHRWTPLWRLHSVHHSVTRFYGFNGLMKHPVHQLFETSVAITPLVVVGLPVDVATALVVCVGVQLLVQHSNVDVAAGPCASSSRSTRCTGSTTSSGPASAT